MRIHHLNCGTCCPLGGRGFDGTTDGPLAHLVCHCLLIETDHGLVLVDTGFGAKDVARPRDRLSPFFLTLNNPQLRAAETAAAQVAALGFRTEDVRAYLERLEVQRSVLADSGGSKSIETFSQGEVEMVQRIVRTHFINIFGKDDAL